MHVLFANTGVQLVCIPLRGGRYQSSQIGYGWQRCAAPRRRQDEPAADLSLHPVADHPVGHDAAVPGRRYHLRRPGSRLLLLAQLADQGLPRSTWKGCWTSSGKPLQGRAADRALHPPGHGHGRRRQARPHGHRLRQQPHRRAAAGTGRRDQPDAADAPLRARSTAITSTPGTRRASPSACPPRGGSPRRPTGATRPTCRPCRRRRSSITPSATRTASGGWFGRGKKAQAGQGGSGRHAAAVRRPLHGPHGPRGRRRGAGHAGRRRHPHRREFAQALPLGRRRQLAGRGQLAHGRSRPTAARPGAYASPLQGPVPQATSTRTTATSSCRTASPRRASTPPRPR